MAYAFQMDAFPEQIADIERRLRAARVSVSSVCRDARIDRSAWHKWKFGGARPRAGTWDSVRSVLEPLIGAVPALPAAADRAA